MPDVNPTINEGPRPASPPPLDRKDQRGVSGTITKNQLSRRKENGLNQNLEAERLGGKPTEEAQFLTSTEEYEQYLGRKGLEPEREEEYGEPGNGAGGGTPGFIQQSAGQGEEQLARIDTKIKEINKEIRPITNNLRGLNTELNLLGAALIAARGTDTLSAIARYLAKSVEIWWWTIVGAIIDIMVVIPALALAYLFGFKKGPAGKKVEKQIDRVKKDIETEKQKIRAEETAKKRLYQQKIEIGARLQNMIAEQTAESGQAE